MKVIVVIEGMLFSIVINNYNYGAYIGQAIESALNQTYQPLEVIVVDDGSTDDSRAVITSFGARIRTLFQENAGQNAACNAGWREAKGGYILFLDADDVLLPDAAEKCVTALKGMDLAKVQFLMQRVDAALNPLDGVMPVYGLKGNTPRKDIALWGHYKTAPMSANAYSRTFLELVMPAPEFRDEPYYMWLDTYLAQIAGLMDKVASIHEPLALYRIHGKNYSNAGDALSLAKLRRLFMNDVLREQYQNPWAEKLGLALKPDRIRFCPHVTKQRFLSYRIEPESHPLAQDSYCYLLAAGLISAIRFPYLSPFKRIVVFFGFLALGLLPRSILQKNISFIARAEERKGTLAWLR